MYFYLDGIYIDNFQVKNILFKFISVIALIHIIYSFDANPFQIQTYLFVCSLTIYQFRVVHFC